MVLGNQLNLKGLRCQNLKDLKKTWEAFPDLQKEDLDSLEKTAERLTPSGINYVLEANVDDDYTKNVLVAAKKDYQILLI